MDYLNSIISGEIDRPQEDNGPCYTFILQDTGRVTAKTIFDSWYGEGEDYDYDQEPKNTNASESIITHTHTHTTFYLFLIFGVTSEIHILLLNE